ncbi:YesL family protein [Enterococcus villorum]|uniref:Membrane protein n=2 Tax=Enterococcus villorum TaxID=112904 RepID=A0A511J506_9ENTE|nr:DUF624 domain-containing protein [Enterococcus villorum]EOH93484.1 hypothetical protein UAO_00213 [Enterococcus villorum ATCC 700913]EOW75435.1 hypothetical protein I591_02524 [Enterococcus villorum ATCC 700913]GEL93080.1 membrane protein [Enterococcus villorum]
MLGKALETLFIRVWVVMKLTFFFWIYTLIGAIVLGVGPSYKTVNELFYRYGFEYKEITFKRGLETFKQSFVRGNLLFGLFLAVTFLLGYNLYLSVQIKGLLFLITDFILIFSLLYAYAMYQYSLILDSEYAISIPNLLKLSFVSGFSSFSTFLKLLIGGAIIFWLTWNYKGLILFGVIGLLTVWNGLITKQWREKLNMQLEIYE